jgi:hypothetical protein
LWLSDGDAQWSLFSSKYQTFGLGQTNWADKFWGIWGIFGQTISPLSMFSILINHYFYKKLMPCPFTGPKMFCARPKIYLHIVVVTNILSQTKRWFAFSKIGFCAGTKGFEEALNAAGLAQKNLTGTKHFGTCKRTRHKPL